MFTDLEQIQPPPQRQCDLLILGAGPAGITLALEAARAQPGLDIVVAEGGGRHGASEAGVELYQGRSTGSNHYSLTGTRLRYFGGTSGHWGGWCRPFDGIDFDDRPGLSAGWPIRRSELNPHYAAAHRWLEIDSDHYDPAGLETGISNRLLDFGDSDWFRNRMFRFSPPTRFGERYAGDIAAAESIECLLHANAVGYRLSPSGVGRVELASLNGNRLQVEAGRVVLAMGGIESTRHLLLMREIGGGPEGLGSRELGRGFADHFGLRPGVLHLPPEMPYHRAGSESGPVMPVIAPRQSALRDEGLGNACMILEVAPEARGLPRAYTRHSMLGFGGSGSWNYEVQMILEPRRNPASRIDLADTRDAFGLPRTRINWEVDPRDFVSGQTIYQRFIREIGSMGLGRGSERKLDAEARSRQVGGVSHHLGSAPMADDVTRGPLDRDLKVFGADNLYVVSSAVFPATGYSNPTLTIVALAHRLARHLTSGGTGG